VKRATEVDHFIVLKGLLAKPNPDSGINKKKKERTTRKKPYPVRGGIRIGHVRVKAKGPRNLLLH